MFSLWLQFLKQPKKRPHSEECVFRFSGGKETQFFTRSYHRQFRFPDNYTIWVLQTVTAQPKVMLGSSNRTLRGVLLCFCRCQISQLEDIFWLHFGVVSVPCVVFATLLNTLFALPKTQPFALLNLAFGHKRKKKRLFEHQPLTHRIVWEKGS